MLKIHTRDGRTLRIDLSDPDQAREWLGRLERDSFQAEISGVSVVEHHLVRFRCDACGNKGAEQVGVQYSVSRPQGINSVRYAVELVDVSGEGRGGERVTVYAGDIRLSLMAHQSQPSARISLSKIGKLRFVPRHSQE